MSSKEYSLLSWLVPKNVILLVFDVISFHDVRNDKSGTAQHSFQHTKHLTRAHTLYKNIFRQHKNYNKHNIAEVTFSAVQRKTSL